MKRMILFVLCLLLLPALPAMGGDDPCWPCWDCLMDCEKGDGVKCCKDAKKECCDDCRDLKHYYRWCLIAVDTKESYSDHLIERNVNRFRQQFENEMGKMQ